MSRTSKSPRKVLVTAWHVAKQSLPAFSHRCSPKKFTQHQLFACLAAESGTHASVSEMDCLRIRINATP
jgi:hypothetical protein